MRPLPTQPLPQLPDFVEGVALIRGSPTVVLDAHRLLGAELEPRAHQRYVTIRLGARRLALAVDAVLGVRHLEQDELNELPALLREPGNDLVQALGTLDHELLCVLERSRLLPESAWQSLAGEARAP